MATPTNPETTDSETTETKVLTVEELQAEIRKRDESIANLTKASEKSSREAQKYREAETARETERKRLEREGLSEPEKLAAKLRETEADKVRVEQERDQIRQARIDDANERAVLMIAPKFLDDDHIDLAWEKIDRSLLTFDDAGKVVAGIDKALEKLVKDRKSWGKVKKVDPGTGKRPSGTTPQDLDPIASAFAGKTSLGT